MLPPPKNRLMAIHRIQDVPVSGYACDVIFRDICGLNWTECEQL